MSAGFRPAERSQAKPLIGLYAESGAGKTWSALLLARGFVGPQGKIGMIDTEGGRGEAFVGRDPVGQYLVRPIRDDFAPVEYGKAITDAQTAKLDALIIDSASHEWEGAGGVLSLAAANQAAGKKGPIVWQAPKLEHQRHFMLRIMQTPVPLVIVCMRAKYPMIEIKNDRGGKEWVRSQILEPKQADDILFEMFVHGWIDREHCFHGSKYTLPELSDVIRSTEPISIASGQRLAAWARGESVTPAATPAVAQPDRAHQAAMPTRAGGNHEDGKNGGKAAPIRFRWIAANGREVPFPSVDQMLGTVLPGVETCTAPQARAARERNAAIMAEISAAGFDDAMIRLSNALAQREAA